MQRKTLGIALLVAALSAPLGAKPTVERLDAKTLPGFVQAGPVLLEAYSRYDGDSQRYHKAFEAFCTAQSAVRCGYVDLDQDMDAIRGPYKVLSAPTTLFLNDGAMLTKQAGVLTADELTQKISELYPAK